MSYWTPQPPSTYPANVGNQNGGSARKPGRNVPGGTYWRK